MTFSALGLSAPLLRALDALDYRQPTPIQAQAIPAVLAGRDLMAAAQTGTGKTAAFALPLLQGLAAGEQPATGNSVRALVLVPTRELAEQVRTSFRAYGQFLPLRSAALYGGVDIQPQIAKLRKGIEVAVATPGRLLDLHSQQAIQLGQVQTLVLDEADRMLDLGFSRELNAIFAALPTRRQTLLFSATFSEAIRALAGTLLHDPLAIDTGPRNTAAKSVKQWVVPVDKKRKPDLFRHLLKTKRWGQVLVFVKTRKGVEQLVAKLQAEGIQANAIHGDKPQAARLKALERFKAGEARILVATDVAARGLDIDALPLVVNFDLPIVAEDYIHRIGRTGRAGAVGTAISLVCADEVELLSAIETLTRQTFKRVEEPGFEPDHRVPLTGTAAPTAKKPAKTAKPRAGATGTSKGAANKLAEFDATGPTTGRRGRARPGANSAPKRQRPR